MMNLELINASGVFLGLEAELNRQRSIQEQHIKDRKWQGALVSYSSDVVWAVHAEFWRRKR